VTGTVRLMAVDPGILHVGLAYLTRTLDVPARYVLDGTEHVHAPKGSGSREDDMRRLDYVTECFWKGATRFAPHALAMETVPYLRNARASVQIATTWGGMFALVRRILGAHVCTVGPGDAKLTMCGSKTAEKIDVIRAVEREFGVVLLPEGALAKDADDAAHVADAVAIGMSAFRSDRMGAAIESRTIRPDSPDDEIRRIIATTERRPRRW
jgi:Holliday junction resolvasome RuvABC endonuclease subunit